MSLMYSTIGIGGSISSGKQKDVVYNLDGFSTAAGILRGFNALGETCEWICEEFLSFVKWTWSSLEFSGPSIVPKCTGFSCLCPSEQTVAGKSWDFILQVLLLLHMVVTMWCWRFRWSSPLLANPVSFSIFLILVLLEIPKRLCSVQYSHLHQHITEKHKNCGYPFYCMRVAHSTG